MISSGRFLPDPLSRATTLGRLGSAREDLHRNAFGLEHLLDVVGGGLLHAGRVARVDPHERLEVAQRFRFDRGASAAGVWADGALTMMKRKAAKRISGRMPHAACGFDARIIQDVPNLSLSCPNRMAKKVSSMGMKICPPSESSAQIRSASAHRQP